ncbi:two-component system, response regulator YesN [Paenibacillus sp. 1_12]|uniref:response regulator n=1 Tax=Paenibacillus sp. 1_12 TaxID=1566278 RepID=UPI0008F04C2D|nr:response regulator [Paenibacillus sp. 1_12]SFK78271.1 two-component system, response regulator YesN [Paenibacillus sp. 1_12]
MLKAVMADDEPIIIKGLKKLIPWEAMGVEIVGEAWTGSGLLQLIEEHKPDLVITDISMPDGSGIDVIKEIEKRELRTRVIFISAYQEFSYAKDAIAYGAVEYLVKPIDKGLLIDAVNKALLLLREHHEGQSSKHKLAVYEQKDRKTQIEELLDRLTEGDIRGNEATRKLQELSLQVSNELLTVMVVSFVKQEDDGRWGDHENRLVLFAITNVIEEMLQQRAGGFVMRKHDSLCIIVNHSDTQSIQKLAEEMVLQIYYYLKIDISIGFGCPVHKLKELRTSYISAIAALKNQYFAGMLSVIPWTFMSQDHPISERKLKERVAALFQAMLNKDDASLSEELDQLFHMIAATSQGSKEIAVTTCFAMIRELVEKIHEISMELQELEQEQQKWLLEMQQIQKYEELKQFVSGRVRELADRLLFIGKEGQQLKLVKEYIEQHFNENITLESMAAMLYMNPYYFSSFFKKHTRVNFKHYVTEIRMKHAVKLLLHTDLLVYEIAEKVGYNNARHFSDMFKKQFGKLPQEYKSHK